MENILTPLYNSPLLPDYVEELTLFLQQEKERRLAFYEWLDEDKKAEFIDGEIVVHSPARKIHITALSNLAEQIKAFVVKKSLGLVLKEQALIRMKRSDFMPVLVFFSNEKAAGIKDDTKIYPLPDFIVEFLSASTEKIDRGKKFVEYALNGVKEYWMVNADEKYVEQYLLIGQEYLLKGKYDMGEAVECIVLKGLLIDVASIFDEKESQIAMQKILG